MCSRVCIFNSVQRVCTKGQTFHSCLSAGEVGGLLRNKGQGQLHFSSEMENAICLMVHNEKHSS